MAWHGRIFWRPWMDRRIASRGRAVRDPCGGRQQRGKSPVLRLSNRGSDWQSWQMDGSSCLLRGQPARGSLDWDVLPLPGVPFHWQSRSRGSFVRDRTACTTPTSGAGRILVPGAVARHLPGLLFGPAQEPFQYYTQSVRAPLVHSCTYYDYLHPTKKNNTALIKK